MSSEPHQMNLPSNWTEQEKWVWEKLSKGEIADFPAEEAKGKLSIETKVSLEWSEKTVISPAFLRTILLDEAYRGAFPWSGVKIIGAWIKGPLFLEDAVLSHPWWMKRCRFEAEVILKGLITPWTISLEGSTFTGLLHMDSLEVKQSLFMNNKAQFAEVNLVSGKVGGGLDMSGSTFKGPLNMNGLEVKQHLLMNNEAQFAEVELTAAKVGGQLAMAGSRFTGPLNMNGLKVGGQLVMDGSTFTGSLIMEHIHIALDLFMRNIVGPGEGQKVNLIFAEILGNLDISGSQLPSLDLTGTKIQGEFRLFQSNQLVKWQPGAKLTLRNTDVGALQDHCDSWPETLDLKDFTYARLGGFYPKGESPVTDQKVAWFCDWLEKQPDYSPQPYQQLANILLKAGHRGKSDEILYAGRERERKSTHGWTWLWMTLLDVTIGYGYKTWRALLWATGFVILGYIALRFWAPNIGTGTPVDEVFYSLNMLLPGVQLNIPHFVIALPPPARYYFYFQRLMGVILGSFLIAGLSGLTKK